MLLGDKCTENPRSEQEPRPDVVECVKRYFESRDFLRRGICLLNAGCHAEAVTAFRAAMRGNPDSSSLPELLARAYMGCGQYAAAVNQLADLVERDSDDIASRVRHGLLLWKGGDRAEAIESLRASVATAPDCAELHFQLGNLLAETGDDEEAEMRYTAAITLDPKHAEATVNLAMCHAARQEPERALRLLRTAQALRPEDARIGLLLGMALRATAGVVGAHRAITEMPSTSMQACDRAVRTLSRIVERDPEFLDVFMEVTADDELFELLSSAIDAAIQRSPSVSGLHFHRGWVMQRLGKLDEATMATEHAVSIAPDDVRALIQLARLHHQADRSDLAIERLEEALRLGACYADVYVFLGRLYRESGECGRARRAYHQALELNADYDEARLALETLSA